MPPSIYDSPSEYEAFLSKVVTAISVWDDMVDAGADWVIEFLTFESESSEQDCPTRDACKLAVENFLVRLYNRAITAEDIKTREYRRMGRMR